MNIPSNLLSYVVAIGVIIFVHELGHHLVAKGFGMRVLTFSLGFGKRLWGFRRGETEYRLSAIPLGGYVRLGGEFEEQRSADPRDFVNRPRWQRVLVYLAGPGMNALLAVVLMAVLFMVGIEVPFLQDVPPIVGMVEPESPASAAGLEPGDRLVSIDGRAIGRWQDAETEIVQSPERALWLEVERHGELLGIEIVPARAPKYEFGVIGAYPRLQPRVAQVFAGTPAAAVGLEPGDLLRGLDGRPVASPRDFVEYVEGRPDVPIALEIVRGGNARTVEITPARDGEVGRIGIQLTISQRLALGAAVRASVAYNWDVTKQTFTLLGRLFQGRIAPKTALHGPIEIAALSGAAARRGMADFAHLLALVSISIGILNLLPVPVLDGGQIFILLVESAMRRDLSTRFKELVQLAGLFLIVALMITVLYFDLERNLPALLGGSSQGPPP